MERNLQIILARIEVLERRRAEIRRELAELEQSRTDLASRYDQRVQSARLGAIWSSGAPPLAKERRDVAARRREAFRLTFVVGLVFSLFVGLMASGGGH